MVLFFCVLAEFVVLYRMDMYIFGMQKLQSLWRNIFIRIDCIDIFEWKKRNNTGLCEFRSLCEYNDALGILCHAADCFSPHEVISHEAVFVEPVRTDENLVDIEILHAFLDHWSNHDLRFVLVFTAEQNDMGIGLLADKSGDEGRVRNDRDIAPIGSELFGQQCAAGAGFNHDRLAVVHGFSCMQGNFAFDFIVKGKMIADVVA